MSQVPPEDSSGAPAAGTPAAGTLGRMLAKAAPFGALCAIIAMGLTGTYSPAGGAFAGAIAAGLYASGYLRSHLTKAGSRERIYDAGLARDALVRLAITAGLGAGAYLLGREVLQAYVLSFGVSFALLVISEIPRARRDLKSRGVIG